MKFQSVFRFVSNLGVLKHHFRREFNSISLKEFSSLASNKTETTVPSFPGATTKWTERLDFFKAEDQPIIPTYRVLDLHGQIINSSQDPKLGEKTSVEMYKCMSMLNTMDKIMYDAQRQGRISFYMTNYGEEAAQVGSSAALMPSDLIYGQYREAGVLLWRGFTLEQFMDQCYGNCDDKGMGRQMPVHYGSKDLNFVTLSSPLTTQMPQAVGSAYAYKRARNGSCVIVYFGDGAASEGDFHAAFNFAATLEAPVIFFCRNNGYAISTPVSEQYRGDGIASRGTGYGISALRVDGNDILAVYNATLAARRYVMENMKPIIVEALTYRVGHHSTSDDSSAYRSIKEVQQWEDINPIHRFRQYLESNNWWNEDQQKEFIASAKKALLKAFAAAEKKPKPEWQEMFYDTYYEMPDHLMKQMKYMEEHVGRHQDKYPVKDYKISK